MTDDSISVTIQNVVASADLHAKINLEKAASILVYTAEVSYIPEQFPGLVVKIKEPKTSALVFSSGKMVITGAKSSTMIEEAVDVLAHLLETQAGVNIEKETSITVQNIVASGSVGGRINLELAALLLDNSMYEPEQFPGLIYRMLEPKPKTVLLLFQSGNLVCTGAKREELVYDAVRQVRQDLEEIEALITDEDEMEGFGNFDF
ncbi:MAG: TATA-box-binding protein [Promethearchaeota archaeon]